MPSPKRKSSETSEQGQNKKQKPAKKQPSEKRAYRYRGKPSVKDRERIERALSRGMGRSHRLYLIERKQITPPGGEDFGEEEFVVLGATGNVYTVTIGRRPHCTCPDAAKGNICKHRFFVMLKVLKVQETDHVLWQNGLLKAEVDQVLSTKAPCDGGALAPEAVCSEYAKATGRTPTKQPAPSTSDKKPEGDCPICFEPLEDAASGAHTEALQACTTCKNYVHADCMGNWIKLRRRGGEQVSCVMCRAPWTCGQGAGSPEAKKVGGYLNLSQNPDRVPDNFDLYGDNALWIARHAGRF